MYVIVVLMAASLLVAIAFLLAFWWAVRSGQYEDTYTPSIRMLFDDLRTADKKSMDDNTAREN